MTPASRSRPAFSLVELLTVVAIIAVLVGLLLPAVQSARESSRRSSCSNNLKQLALGCLQYEASQGHFPSGGWGFQWTGDPDAGLGQPQPGGWSYQILPFVEHQATFEMGADGVVPRTEPPTTNGSTTTQRNAARDRGAVPIQTFVCPSRRGPGVLPCVSVSGYLNMAAISLSAGIDYAGSGGTASPQDTFSGTNGGSNGFPLLATLTRNATGIIYGASRVTPAHVRDGLSATVLLGEYNRNPDYYGEAIASIYGGGSLVVAVNGLSRDRAGIGGGTSRGTGNFGSAHPVNCFFAFCDGAVRPIRYDIQASVRSRLFNRADGQLLDLDGL